MRYRAIIFDLDGTLLNTIEDLADSTNIVLKHMGFPIHDVEEYRYFIGNGMHNLVRRAIPEEYRDDETVSKCTITMKEEYSKRLIKKTRPYQGIPELLDKLSYFNLKMSILSNKHDDAAKFVAAKLLSKWNFDIVLGERLGVPRKPDPSAAFEIVRRLNIPVQEFLYVGDSGVDMQTANAAGMFAVGVLWGFRGADELKEAGANVLIEEPDELIKLL